MTNILEKFIVFTDLSDYTLKSSLLTPKQLKEFIIDKQDEIILPFIKKYNGELVKYIGDSYFILFDRVNDATNFSITLQKKLKIYNKNIKLNLKKLELKIVINFGGIIRKKTKFGNDYFGDILNISSRILDKTPKNSIYISDPIFRQIKNRKLDINYLGDFTFRGVIYKIPLYEIDLGYIADKDDNSLKYNKIIDDVDMCIFKISSVAFLLTIQPIPLLDRYFMVLLHLFLLKQVALKYGVRLSKKEIKEIVGVIFVSIGSIYTTSHIMTGIGKIGLPFLGGYLLAPMSFGLTYALGKVFSNYFYFKLEKNELTNEDIKDIFIGTKQKGIDLARKQKTEIIKTGKKYKDTIIKNVKKIDDLYDDVKDVIKNTKN